MTRQKILQVQTPDAVKELASRSEQKNVVGYWKQMLDPHTLQYWYLFDKEDTPLRACWLAPPEFKNTFHCRFDSCVIRSVFSRFTITLRSNTRISNTGTQQGLFQGRLSKSICNTAGT